MVRETFYTGVPKNDLAEPTFTPGGWNVPYIWSTILEVTNGHPLLFKIFFPN